MSDQRGTCLVEKPAKGGLCLYQPPNLIIHGVVTVLDILCSVIIRVSLGKLLVNLLQVVKRTNAPLTPQQTICAGTIAYHLPTIILLFHFPPDNILLIY